MGSILVWSTTSPPPEPPQPGPPDWVSLDKTGGGKVTGLAADSADGDKVWCVADNGGVFLTLDGGDTWVNQSYNLGACRLGGIFIDPNDDDVVYVTASMDFGQFTSGGDEGEIHRTLDGGDHWEFVADGMGFQTSSPAQRSLAIPLGYDADADNIGDVIVAMGWNGPGAGVGGIWRSTDEGAVFGQIAVTPASTENMVAVHMHGADNDIMYACSWGGKVFKTTDAGATWTDVSNAIEANNFSDIAVDAVDPAIVYVATRNIGAGNRSIQKTIDSGANWTNASTGLDPSAVDDFTRIIIDKDDADTLYITSDGGAAGTAVPYKTIDAGANWTAMDTRLVIPDGRPFFWYTVEGNDALVESASGILFASEQGPIRNPAGDPPVTDWEPCPIGYGNVHVQALVVDPQDATRIWHGIDDFGIYRSDDSGVTSGRILGNGWPVTTVNYVWNGPYYSNYAKCVGNLSAGATTGIAVSYQDTTKVYSCFRDSSGGYSFGGVNLSTDTGATWAATDLTSFIENAATCLPYGFERMVVDPTDDDIAYALQRTGANDLELFKTINSGTAWTSVYDAGQRPRDLAISEADNDVVVLVGSGIVKLTTNGGTGWSTISPASSNFRSVALSPHDANDIVIGTLEDGWWVSDDQGGTWTHYEYESVWTMAEALPEDRTAWNPGYTPRHSVFAIAWDPNDAGTYYLAGELRPYGGYGVIKCETMGATWERLTLTGLQHRDVYALALDAAGDTLYAGGFDGLYSLDIS